MSIIDKKKNIFYRSNFLQEIIRKECECNRPQQQCIECTYMDCFCNGRQLLHIRQLCTHVCFVVLWRTIITFLSFLIPIFRHNDIVSWCLRNASRGHTELFSSYRFCRQHTNRCDSASFFQSPKKYIEVSREKFLISSTCLSNISSYYQQINIKINKKLIFRGY